MSFPSLKSSCDKNLVTSLVSRNALIKSGEQKTIWSFTGTSWFAKYKNAVFNAAIGLIVPELPVLLIVWVTKLPKPLVPAVQ